MIAEAFALAGAGDEAGDIYKFDRRWYHYISLGDALEHVSALIGHDHDAHIGIDRAEGVVGGLRLTGTGEGVEESGFTHIGESDDACF